MMGSRVGVTQAAPAPQPIARLLRLRILLGADCTAQRNTCRAGDVRYGEIWRDLLRYSAIGRDGERLERASKIGPRKKYRVGKSRGSPGVGAGKSAGKCATCASCASSPPRRVLLKRRKRPIYE